jgi:simple sugar transport system permease protein
LESSLGVGLVLKRTQGVELRASGLDPWAAAAKGVLVTRIRTYAVLTTGLFAGLGGAAISPGVLGTFGPGRTAGRGFVAIALVIVGRWSPGWTLAALTSGAANALQLRLQALVDAPTQLLATLPWIVGGLTRGIGRKGGSDAPYPRSRIHRHPIAHWKGAIMSYDLGQESSHADRDRHAERLLQ